MKRAGHSLRELCRITGAAKETVKRAIEIEGLKPLKGNAKYKRYPASVIERIVPHLKHYDGPEVTAAPGEANVDPRSGLTWAQLLTREKALATERENEERLAKVEARWILAEDVQRVMAAVVSRLDQVASKARSEYGLSDIQFGGIARLVDEVRTQAADEIERMKP